MLSLASSKLPSLLLAATALLVPLSAAASEIPGCTFMEFRSKDLKEGHAMFCCDTDQSQPGDPKRLGNSLNLGSFISNDFGKLNWRDYGGYAGSCKDCNIGSEWGQTMSCSCKTGVWLGFPIGWQYKDTKLDPWLYALNDRLVNENGHIHCKDNHELDAAIDNSVAC